MGGFIEQASGAYGADFIDAIGELVAAIFNHNARFIERLVAAINICNTAHATAFIS
jgi:hypothetical protein